MLEAHLKIANLCWSDNAMAPAAIDGDLAGTLTGRFAFAYHDGQRIVLARDPLGLNKLFLGYHPERGVIAASYLIDLIHAGIPFGGSYSVLAGSVVTIDAHLQVRTRRFRALPASTGSSRRPEVILPEIAERLTLGLQRLATCYSDAPVAICLSGGADSALIAAYAKRQFPQAVAYTYTCTAGDGPSEDAIAAREVARHLGLELRQVTADASMILRSLQCAITYGQDWRDFNVHAAIVSDLLAQAIAADHRRNQGGPAPIVLTGDLMNELLGDYSPVRYAGATYYQLPQLSPGKLRLSLTRGIQTGDREVGVFKAHGLDVAQPYGWVFDKLLELPDPVVKHEIIMALAGSALPEEILRRPKVRAQIGDHEARRGILPLLLRTGHDSRWLQAEFCRALSIASPRALHQRVRAGIYRPLPQDGQWQETVWT